MTSEWWSKLITHFYPTFLVWCLHWDLRNCQNKKMTSSQADYDVITASHDTFYTIKYWNLIYATNTLQIFLNLQCRNSNIRIYKDKTKKLCMKKVDFVAPTACDGWLIEPNLERVSKNDFNTMFLTKIDSHKKHKLKKKLWKKVWVKG